MRFWLFAIGPGPVHFFRIYLARFFTTLLRLKRCCLTTFCRQNFNFIFREAVPQGFVRRSYNSHVSIRGYKKLKLTLETISWF